MAHEFELRLEQEIAGTPEQVWDAIATGPGIDSWFMGRSQVEPGVGGSVNTDMGEGMMASTITTWAPGQRFAYRGEPDADGRFMAFEYLIEGREGGSTVLRYVHSGMLGDDWESEYDALRKGSPMYLAKLAAYVEHFSGRATTHSALVLGPQVADGDRVWSAVGDLLGTSASPAPETPVRVAIDGARTREGVVDYTGLPTWLLVRTDDAILTFMHAQGFAIAEHHMFDDVDGAAEDKAIQSWLTTTFA